MGIAASDDILLTDDVFEIYGFTQAASTPDGGRIATWVNDSRQIVTRRYDAAGNAIGEEIVISPHVIPSRIESMQIFSAPGGGWVQAYSVNKNGSTLHIVQYDADGNLVSEATQPGGERLVELSNGGFLVLTMATGQYVGDWYYRSATATIFDAAGHKIGTTPVGLMDNTDQIPTTSFDDGKWSTVVVETDASRSAILFDASGNVLSRVSIGQNDLVRFDDSGSYTIIHKTTNWASHTVTQVFEHYTADHVLIDSVTPDAYEFKYYYGGHNITQLSNGNQIVVWSGTDDANQQTWFSRVLDAQGHLVVADTLIAEASPNSGESVLELSNGGWVIFCEGYQQVFNADGTKFGGTLAALTKGDSRIVNAVATDDGGWTLTYLSGDATTRLYSRTFHTNDINNAPEALDGNSVGGEDHLMQVTLGRPGYDYDGDAISAIVITDLPEVGTLRLDGHAVAVGDTIASSDWNKLTWRPPANANGDVASLRYRAVDEHGLISENIGRLNLEVTAINDAPTSDDKVITVREDEKRALLASDFPFSDIDGDHIWRLAIRSVDNTGHLTIQYQDLRNSNHVYLSGNIVDPFTYQSERNESGKHYAVYQFRVFDDGEMYDGGQYSDKHWHTLTFNVLPVNDAPLGSDVQFQINPDQTVGFIDDYFRIRDIEGDALKSIVIDALPSDGVFLYDGRRLRVGDEIAREDFDKLSFTASHIQGAAELQFSIRDNGGTKNGGVDVDTTANTLTFNVSENANVLWGTTGNDHLIGSAGRDVVYGGKGNDTLFGGAGNDRFFGGSGRDTFVFAGRNNNDDTIMDFDVSADRIDLRGSQIKNFASLLATSGDYYDGFVIPFEYMVHHKPRTDHLHVVNVSEQDLSANNFLF
jgi:hypothetical protein